MTIFDLMEDIEKQAAEIKDLADDLDDLPTAIPFNKLARLGSNLLKDINPIGAGLLARHDPERYQEELDKLSDVTPSYLEELL